jgi:hypothetical protein
LLAKLTQHALTEADQHCQRLQIDSTRRAIFLGASLAPLESIES